MRDIERHFDKCFILAHQVPSHKFEIRRQAIVKRKGSTRKMSALTACPIKLSGLRRLVFHCIDFVVFHLGRTGIKQASDCPLFAANSV
jgi:hypothetical protein